jgi:dynein heavy chain, axonemal
MLFVDDVNMPATELYGAQPPLELLRQLVDCGGMYHRKKQSWMEIQVSAGGVQASDGGGAKLVLLAGHHRRLRSWLK